MGKAIIYVSAEHLAAALGIDKKTVLRWKNAGLIETKAVKSVYYIPVTPLSDDLDANKMTVAVGIKFETAIEFEKQSERPGALNIIKYNKTKATDGEPDEIETKGREQE